MVTINSPTEVLSRNRRVVGFAEAVGPEARFQIMWTLLWKRLAALA